MLLVTVELSAMRKFGVSQITQIRPKRPAISGWSLSAALSA
jgi:hypothetical protein